MEPTITCVQVGGAVDDKDRWGVLFPTVPKLELAEKDFRGALEMDAKRATCKTPGTHLGDVAKKVSDDDCVASWAQDEKLGQHLGLLALWGDEQRHDAIDDYGHGKQQCHSDCRYVQVAVGARIPKNRHQQALMEVDLDVQCGVRWKGWA